MQAALVLARLRSHLGRSLVLVVVVVVAAGIALSALAVLRVANDPWAPLQAATLGGDVEIDEAPARPDPQALAALPEVRTVGALIESGDAALQVHGEVLLMSLKRMPDRETMTIDRPLMLAGRWFAADDEVVFEATLADTLGVGVGDTVTLHGEHGRTVRVVGTAATTMLPNYPERLPGSIFAGQRLFDAIDPVGTPRWSIGLRLRDPSQADAVVARLNRAGPVPAGTCTAAGWCARTSADIRDDAFPTRDRLVRAGHAVLRGADADRGGAVDRHAAGLAAGQRGQGAGPAAGRRRHARTGGVADRRRACPARRDRRGGRHPGGPRGGAAHRRVGSHRVRVGVPEAVAGRRRGRGRRRRGGQRPGQRRRRPAGGPP
jgi:hypothetical protein